MSQPLMGVSMEQAVRAFYRSLLMREPDDSGLRQHVHSLASGARTLEEVLASFLQSAEFKRMGPDQYRAATVRAAGPLTNDRSQFGEFGILLRHWVNEGARHRIVVDVGARGRDRSNSYDLLRFFDWRGLLIEANPALIAPIRRDFEGLNIELLNVAVSDFEGHAAFHIGVNDDVSSLTAEAAKSWGEVAATVEVEVRRLGGLLTAQAIPDDFDLLSLDIEGEDLKVLNDLIDTTAYRPRWVIVEASYEYRTTSLADLPLSPGVTSIYRIAGQTPANLILRHISS